MPCGDCCGQLPAPTDRRQDPQGSIEPRAFQVSGELHDVAPARCESADDGRVVEPLLLAKARGQENADDAVRSQPPFGEGIAGRVDAEFLSSHPADNARIKRIEDKVRASLGRQELPEPIRLPTLATAPGNFFSALAQIWSPLYRQRTMMIWSVWFFALLGFYGLTSWLSALLQQSGFAVTQSVYYTVLISLGGIPGFLMAAWLVERWGRKPVLVLCHCDTVHPVGTIARLPKRR